MTKKGESRSGAGDNFNDDPYSKSVRHRFQDFIARCIEKTAGRIVERFQRVNGIAGFRTDAALSRTLREAYCRHEPSRTHTIRKYYAWTIGCSFIGDERFYQKLRDALREKGLEYTANYFATTDDITKRIKAFNQNARQVAAWKKGKTNEV